MKLICEHSCTMDRFNLPEMWAKRKAERKLCLVKFLGQRNLLYKLFAIQIGSHFRSIQTVHQWEVLRELYLFHLARERASRGSIRYITDWTATLWNSYSLWLVKGCTAPVHKLAVRPTMWQTLYWWIFEMLDFLKCIPNPEGFIRKGFMTRDYTEYTEVPANNMAWLLRGRNLQKYFKAILWQIPHEPWSSLAWLYVRHWCPQWVSR